jgi:iron complex transport system ATP-binding protein
MTGLSVDTVGVELDRTRIIHEVSCRIGSGGWLAVLGPNGAGKSTLLRAIAGLLPYTGTITVGATPLAGLRIKDRARLLAFVPQAPTMPPDTTVEEYVLLGRTAHLGYLAGPGAADRRIAALAVEQLDLTAFNHRRLGTLSGGERQRAALARALAQQPEVLLLDEPTAALDLGHQQQLLELIDRLRRPSGDAAGLTVITTLHDLTAAGQYADELVLLDRGRVAAAGRPAAVLTERRIAEVYGARVAVTADEFGRPQVTPVRTEPAPDPFANRGEHGEKDSGRGSSRNGGKDN